MLHNVWYNITSWFSDLNSRILLIRKFNHTARQAYIHGIVPTLLKVSTSRGNSSYKHRYSKWLQSGFRIKAFSGRQLSRDELKTIGQVVLSDDVLVRNLVVLGWDTLEIQSDTGSFGLQWQLRDYMLLS